jgi:sugar fermentation stimulation protein A
MERKYVFDERLIEALIKSRPNRFIMNVLINGKVVKCHCPSTGRIGSIKFEDIPCLLSKSTDPNRKTPYTVEAFSLDPINKKQKDWIGINQTKANAYVEFFLKTNQLEKIVDVERIGKIERLEREVKVNNSRIDFRVNGRDLLEVKIPLMDVPCEEHPKYKPNHTKFVSFDRMIKHFKDITNSNRTGRSIFLLCYMFNAKPFVIPELKKSERKIVRAAKRATLRGLEHWQINLRTDANGVRLTNYFKLKLEL